jgi:hypothetical protein
MVFTFGYGGKNEYGVSSVKKAAAANFETKMLKALRTMWTDRRAVPLSRYLRLLVSEEQEIMAVKKLVGSVTGLRVVDALLLKHALDQFAGIHMFQAVHQKYMAFTHADGFSEASLLPKLRDEVEMIEVACGDAGVAQRGAAPPSMQGQGKHKKPGRGGFHSSGGGSAASGPQQDKSKQQFTGKQQHRGDKKISAAVRDDASTLSPAEDFDSVNFTDYPVVDATVSATNSLPTKRQKAFLVDSGATDHCVREQSVFTSFRPNKSVVRVADGKPVVATGVGDVILFVKSVDGNLVELSLKDVLFVPSLANNIFSTNKYLASTPNAKIHLDPSSSTLTWGQGTTIQLHSDVKLMWILPEAVKDRPTQSTTTKVKEKKPAKPTPSIALQKLHERLGHLSFRDCVLLAKRSGITLAKSDDQFCDVCQTSKMKKAKIGNQASRDMSIRQGAIVHCDLKGPLEHRAYNGHRFAIVFIDEATRVTVVRTMRSKSGVPKAFKSALSEFAQMSIRVGQGSILHADAERVIWSEKMLELLNSLGIQARSSPPHTHERNGIAERAIQSIFNMTRALLQQSGLGKQFWNVALRHAVYIRNRVPTAALGDNSPLEQLTGESQDISQLRCFGSVVYVKIDESARQALDPKSRKGIYVGNSAMSKSFRVMFQDKRHVTFCDTIHCTFNEMFTKAQGSDKVQREATDLPLAASSKDPLLDDF